MNQQASRYFVPDPSHFPLVGSAALFLLAMLYYDIQQGQAPAEEDVAPAGHRPSFEGAMADIAYEMLDSIR